MARWKASYELINKNAGIFATINAGASELTALVSMRGASTPSGQDDGQEAVLVRDFAADDVQGAKAWIEGVLIGAAEIAEIEQRPGSVVGFASAAWARAVKDQIAQLRSGEEVQ